MKNKQQWSLEWGASGIKLVRLSLRKKKWELDEMWTLDWPLVGSAYPVAVDPLSRVESLKAFMKEKRLPRLIATLCIPRYEVFLRCGDKKEIDFPLPLEKIYGGETGTGRRWTTAGVPRARLDRILQALSQAGIEVDGVGINTTAQIRTLGELRKAPSSYYLVDFGISHIQFTVVRDSWPVFSRSFYVGTPDWPESIRGLLRSSVAEGVKEGVIIGGEIQTSALKKITDGPLVKIPASVSVTLAAIGQALLRDKSDALWLIPPRPARTPVRSFVRSHSRAVTAAAVTTFLLVQFFSGRVADDLTLQIRNLERSRQIPVSIQVEPASHTLTSVLTNIPARAFLTNYQYEAGTKKVSLRGQAPSYEAISDLVTRLSTRARLKEVKSGRLRSAGPSGVEFDVEGTVF